MVVFNSSLTRIQTDTSKIFIGIEDEENWHGKPLGAKSDASVQAIMENIVNKEKHHLCPQSPDKDLPVVAFGSCKLSEPPNYKIGDMVSSIDYGVWKLMNMKGSFSN